jgi:hypothetical protein
MPVKESSRQGVSPTSRHEGKPVILGAFCALVCAVFPWQLQVGPQFDAQAANEVVRLNGLQVASYVDDTTPNQAAYIAQDVAAGVTTIAGISPATPRLRFAAPVVNAQEWYPRHWSTPARAQAYIVRPNQVANAERLQPRPLLILTYSGPL